MNVMKMGNDSKKTHLWPPYIHKFLASSPILSSPSNCSSPTIAILKNGHRVIQSLQCCTRSLRYIGCGRNLVSHEGCRTDNEGILKLD